MPIDALGLNNDDFVDFVKTVEIFLVESDDGGRAYLQNAFEQSGFFVKPFSSSELMLIHLMRYPTNIGNYRCVVLNEHQQGIGGLEAQAQIRKLEPGLQVISLVTKPPFNPLLAPGEMVPLAFSLTPLMQMN